MTGLTPAFPRNKRNTRSIVFIGYFLAPFIASQGAVAVWSVVGARLWGTDDGGAGLVRARFGRGEDSADGLEEGPETGEAGANDAKREFGVGPDTCGCVVPFWTVIVSLSYLKRDGARGSHIAGQGREF